MPIDIAWSSVVLDTRDRIERRGRKRGDIDRFARMGNAVLYFTFTSTSVARHTFFVDKEHELGMSLEDDQSWSHAGIEGNVSC